MYPQDTPSHNQASSATAHGAAVVQVRRPSGRVKCFEAESVVIDGTWVNATGCWRGEARRETLTWPARSILELRFEETQR
jgi:hypothetical protein